MHQTLQDTQNRTRRYEKDGRSKVNPTKSAADLRVESQVAMLISHLRFEQ